MSSIINSVYSEREGSNYFNSTLKRSNHRILICVLYSVIMWWTWRWQAIDYARLNHSTISFFNFLKPETASSRWNRISLNASKVFLIVTTSLFPIIFCFGNLTTSGSFWRRRSENFNWIYVLFRLVRVCQKMPKLRNWHFNTGLKQWVTVPFWLPFSQFNLLIFVIFLFWRWYCCTIDWPTPSLWA